ncbi:hypothetical protein BU23DRAFT_48860 [Bimuria novae-zelandiae CBS 107.79]|uniref:Uncharacterized protein n=1 Tax=Bimuria novae-zelandiae CBS 107.79 TaxID=1447943 RepID=A0A6A5UI06_9PLEO|nr:hypothetical protein BU23DRAFT_48860 [Bimuria novae-zelandiae CBS 107.79]
MTRTRFVHVVSPNVFYVLAIRLIHYCPMNLPILTSLLSVCSFELTHHRCALLHRLVFSTQAASTKQPSQMATIQPASFLAIGWMAWCFVGRRTGWMA